MNTYNWIIAFIFIISLSGCYSEPPSPKKMLNPDHQFTFNSCEIRYNDEPLVLGESVDEWVKVLGPYDRMSPTANDVYVYDDMGVILYANWNSGTIKSITLLFNLEEQEQMLTRASLEDANQRLKNNNYIKGSAFDKEHYQLMKESLANQLLSKPKHTFKQGFAIDGVIFDENFERNRVNPDRLKKHPDAPRFGRSYLPTIYSTSKACDYGELLYQFRSLSTDLKRLHSFVAEI